MPGVIFLDFDGPIFPSKVFLFPENSGEISVEKCKTLELHPYVTYWKADPVAIAMLNKFYEYYPYDLVISSSWADSWLHEKKHIEGVLDENNLTYNLHKNWRTPREKYDTRHEQIAHWLRENPEYKDKYIILDDHSSGDLLFDEETISNLNLKKENIYLVNVHEGLTYADFKSISKQLASW